MLLCGIIIFTIGIICLLFNFLGIVLQAKGADFIFLAVYLPHIIWQTILYAFHYISKKYSSLNQRFYWEMEKGRETRKTKMDLM